MAFKLLALVTLALAAATSSSPVPCDPTTSSVPTWTSPGDPGVTITVTVGVPPTDTSVPPPPTSVAPPSPTGTTGSGNGTWGHHGGDPHGKCSTGPIQCCNTLTDPRSEAGQALLPGLLGKGGALNGLLNSLGLGGLVPSLTGKGGLLGQGGPLGSLGLGPVVDSLLGPEGTSLGQDCSPLVGLLGSGTCSANVVCCKNNAVGGLVSIGCVPIIL